MKKAIICLLLFIVLLLAWGYKKAAQQDLNERLIADAYYGDFVSVKNDVEEGAQLSFIFYFQDEERQYNGVEFNALHAAASSGNEDIINFLLNQKMDINARTDGGWTPLFIAARDGRAEAAKLLVYRGADVNAQSDSGATALTMALTQKFPSETERNEVLLYMLKRGGNPNLVDNYDLAPLYYAATAGHTQAVALLLEYGADKKHPSVKKALSYLKKHEEPSHKKIIRLLTTPKEL